MEDDKENGYLLPLMQSKIDVQNQIITLMQTEMEIQNEKISAQETEIKMLGTVVKELQKQVSKLTTDKACNPIATTREAAKGEEGVGNTSESHSNVQDKRTKVDVSSSGTDSAAAAGTSVADMAKQTAEATLVTSGFVYDENSGLYYDYNTGYYYDSNRQLYYNGHTRTYYSYNESRKEYVFHSQLPLETSENKIQDSQTRKKIKLKHRATQTMLKPSKTESVDVEKNRKSRVKNATSRESPAGDDIEEGELSSSSGDSDSGSITIIEKSEFSDSDVSHGTVDVKSDSSDEETIVKDAPCIRAIIQASVSTTPKLQKGFLFIVTCMGGTIGRDGAHHTIIIPDPNVSKDHAKITYDYEQISDETTKRRLVKKYFITDLGSQNGTFLNRKRLSASNVISEPFEIIHGSVLQILDTQLLIHIHPGLETCGHCEPGLILEKEEVVCLNGPFLNHSQKEAIRKRALRKMRQKYAIGPAQASAIPDLIEKYKDRAEDRRRLLGSEHPSFKIAEAEPASIHVPLDEHNKGFKMLKKMGWSKGESLGQNGEAGMREPVKFEVKLGRAGLGSGAQGFGNNERSSSPPPSHHVRKRQTKNKAFLQKTFQRYIAAEKLPDYVAANISTRVGDNSKVKARSDDVIQLD